jgi:hypothetical protein
VIVFMAYAFLTCESGQVHPSNAAPFVVVLGALVNGKVACVGANEQKRAPCLVAEAGKLARKTANPVVEKGKSRHDAHHAPKVPSRQVIGSITATFLVKLTSTAQVQARGCRK